MTEWGEVNVIYSGRRTLSLEVREGRPVVRAPHAIDHTVIEGFIRQKRAWLQQKVTQQQQRLRQIPQRQYVHGEVVPLLGQSLSVRLQTAARPSVLLLVQSSIPGQTPYLQISVPADREHDIAYKHQLLERFYRQQAEQVLGSKTRQLADSLNLPLTHISYRKTKTKWGHCTSAGVIQYNWLIVLAPEAVVDYLVAHEVSHLRHPNHSAAFWATVKSLQPDYEHHRLWLRQHGHTLVV